MPGGLPRSLLPIYGIVFVDILGFTILIPLLPFVAKRFAAPDAEVGALLTTTAVFATLSSPFWGALSDRVGRKRALLGSQACSFAAYLLLAFAPNLAVLFFSRAVEGLGGGNLGVAQSYVGDVTTEEQRPLAFAWGAAAFGGGFVVGPILSGGLAHFGLAVPFFVAAGLQVLNAGLTLAFLPESHAAPATPAGRREILRALRNRAVQNLLVRQLLYIFAYTYLFTIVSLYLSHLDDGGPEQSSLVLGIAGVVGASATIFGADRLVRRFGIGRVTQASFALGTCAYVALAFVGTLAAFVPVLVVWAASGALLRPTLNALLSDVAPEDERGVIMGFADSLGNFALIFAPALGAAVVGWNYRATGVVPALALAAAFLVGARAPRTVAAAELHAR